MSDEPVFETGAKVCLASGGMGMMVDWEGRVPEGDFVPCVFFDEAGAFHARAFSAKVLKADDRMSMGEWLAKERADLERAGA